MSGVQNFTAKLLFWSFFSENYIKLKKLDPSINLLYFFYSFSCYGFLCCLLWLL